MDNLPPHMHASPPTTSFFCASVPTHEKQELLIITMIEMFTNEIMWITFIILNPIFTIGDIIQIPRFTIRLGVIFNF